MADLQPTVFVVDDDDAVRDSLGRLFSSVGLPFETFASGGGFLASCAPDSAGCLVVDMRMPGMSGFDIQEEIKARGLALPVIVITGYGDVESGVRAMKAGAIDFIQKPLNDQALLEMVQKALAQSVDSLSKKAELNEARRQFDGLTPREREVLECIVAGEPNKRIAHLLNLSEKTVEFHRANLMKKTEARSLADLIARTLKYVRPGENPR